MTLSAGERSGVFGEPAAAGVAISTKLEKRLRVVDDE